jgi:hypothetical protein
MFGSVCDDLVHEGEGFDGCALDYIDDDAAYDSFEFLGVGEGLDDAAGYGAPEGVADNDYVLFWVALHEFFEDLDGLGLEGFD